MRDRAETLARICAAVDDDDADQATTILARDYPFVPLHNVGRNYTTLDSMRVFVRDGFIDRYSGERLVFPGTLRALSLMFPAHFPFHPNWKTDACHFAYYELSPTIDHIVPITRGGSDVSENWVTTSMIRNAAKGNFLIEELGWRVLPRGDIAKWDGLTSWFFRQNKIQNYRSHNATIRSWADAALNAFAEASIKVAE